jgi:hypothetical protein
MNDRKLVVEKQPPKTPQEWYDLLAEANYWKEHWRVKYVTELPILKKRINRLERRLHIAGIKI